MLSDLDHAYWEGSSDMEWCLHPNHQLWYKVTIYIETDSDGQNKKRNKETYETVSRLRLNGTSWPAWQIFFQSVTPERYHTVARRGMCWCVAISYDKTSDWLLLPRCLEWTVSGGHRRLLGNKTPRPSCMMHDRKGFNKHKLVHNYSCTMLLWETGWPPLAHQASNVDVSLSLSLFPPPSSAKQDNVILTLSQSV